MKNRIAIFQYDFPIQSYTKNLIIALSDAGYKIDFFTTFSSTYLNIIDLEPLKSKENIRIHVMGIYSSKVLYLTHLVFNKIQSLLPTMTYVINPNFLKYSCDIIEENKDQYICSIGIEKKGLIWAGEVSEEIHIPFIYYSLELYVEDHPSYHKFKSIRPFEIHYHKRAIATIIQDRRRAEVLFKYDKISSNDMILFPISVKGDIIERKTKYFQEKFNINEDKKIGLYFGMICKNRYCTSLAEISKNLGKNGIVFHGYGAKRYLHNLEKYRNVSISTDLVDEDEILNIISSADIGISLYNNGYSNDRLTAFSSEKVALYMQVGLPIISFRNESYEQLFNSFKCGEMINSIDEFPLAFQKITENYDMYREECFKAFYKYYSYETNIKNLLMYLDHLK